MWVPCSEKYHPITGTLLCVTRQAWLELQAPLMCPALALSPVGLGHEATSPAAGPGGQEAGRLAGQGRWGMCLSGGGAESEGVAGTLASVVMGQASRTRFVHAHSLFISWRFVPFAHQFLPPASSEVLASVLFIDEHTCSHSRVVGFIWRMSENFHFINF